MKTLFRFTLWMLVVGLGCAGMLIGCGDEDTSDHGVSSITSADPSHGYMLNSTPYYLQIDLGEKEEFALRLNPGMLIEMNLDTNRTYVLHVVVLNSANRTVSEYINTFYIDDIPLDNQLNDFVCSWYVEFTPNYPEYGYANNFGT